MHLDLKPTNISGTSRYRAQSAPGPLSLIPASQMGLRPFGSGSSDEDPYSVAGSGSSGSSGNNNRNGKGSTPPADRPPKLPPRDNPTSIYGASIWARPLESQLRYAEQKNANVGGGHNSRKDGNNNKTKAKRSTGGKNLSNFELISELSNVDSACSSHENYSSADHMRRSEL